MTIGAYLYLRVVCYVGCVENLSKHLDPLHAALFVVLGRMKCGLIQLDNLGQSAALST